jgi:tRNA A-37 threonylcarbamoyl transferase component Bud32
VKVFPLVAPGHRLRAWIGRSQADVEFHRLCRLRAAGAPVPAPLAIGRGPAAQALVMEDFGDVPVFRDLLAGGTDRRARRALLDKAADAVASLHAAGFIHEDLHAGNLLVLGDGSMRVIDVQRGRMLRDPSVTDRSISLAHLLLSLAPLADDLEQLRLLRRYAASARMGFRSWRTLVWSAVADLGILRRRHVQGQIDRARGGGSRVWIGSWKGGIARAAFGAREWLDAPETVEAVVKDEAGRRVLRVAKGGHRLAVKEESHRGRAVRAWEAAHGWLAAGLPTPRPYFLHETPSGPVRLATEWVEGGESSSLWVERRLQQGASPAWRRSASRALGRLVRRIHDRGVYHADLKAGNVLVREPDTGAPEFHVLDLDRVAFGERAVSRSKAFSNLAQLNAVFIPPVTRSDRLRCYRAYAGRSAELIRGWKEAVREIMRMTIDRRHRWP